MAKWQCRMTRMALDMTRKAFGMTAFHFSFGLESPPSETLSSLRVSI